MEPASRRVTRPSVSNPINVRYLNVDGGGYAETVETEEGITVDEFLAAQDVNPDNYQILLNREPCQGSDVLRNGNVLSVTPLKVAGA